MAVAYEDCVSSQMSAAVQQEGGGRRWLAVLYLALHLLTLTMVWTGVTCAELLWCLLFVQVRGFCISAGYHRLLAHRSFKTSRVVQFLLAAGACTVMRGGPLWWAALHRRHHRISDTEDDIFTPAKGLVWSYGGWLLSGRYDQTDYDQVRDLARCPELRWLNRNWLLPPLFLAALTFVLGGWSGFVIIFCLSSVVLLHVLGLLDAFNHLLGQQRYDTGDESRNSFFLAVLANGEGWHNNHHHYPASARLGFHWWQVDGTYTVLWLLSCCGLVWRLHTVPEAVRQRIAAPRVANLSGPGDNQDCETARPTEERTA